jgi:meromycolic acid enoyl-[acyl-carrier-protein] reductase
MSGTLLGKTILISGVLTQSSIAYDVAERVQSEGGRVVLTGFGRRRGITENSARRLIPQPPVLEFDAEHDADIDGLARELAKHVDRLDGVVHCISASYPGVVGDGFMTARWADVEHSMRVSAYSFQSLTCAALPLLSNGGSVVGCTLDASVAWPFYGWAGVAKAAYESTNQYLAHHLGSRGIRVNLVAAGPVESATMKAVAGTEGLGTMWNERAPLGWDPEAGRQAVATTIATLLSDALPGVTGEVIHCDGGFHARAY